jgi:Beta-1,3-glucanase
MAFNGQQNPTNLVPPPIPFARKPRAAQAGVDSMARVNGLPIKLVNSTESSTVYAYITGRAIDHSNCLFLLQADSKTPYYPANPPRIGSTLSADCSIPLGPPGHSVTATIPHIAGGRIWFSVGAKLTFLLNPGGDGAALVEPSVSNRSDPNYNVEWGFMEFTYNAAEMYANITFVDFVSIPIAISLTNRSGGTKSVPGMPPGGLEAVASKLEAQTRSDGYQAWSDLIIKSPTGSILRALSPNNGLVLKPGDFGSYYDSYVSQVIHKYASSGALSATISGKTYTGHTNSTNGTITLGNEVFARPTTSDIFSSNSGPFSTGPNVVRNNLIAQLAAAFNRSTLLFNPNLQTPSTDFYRNYVTNHYARIVHEEVMQGRGYAMPYDDVPPSSGADQSGFVNDTAPALMTVVVGAV